MVQIIAVNSLLKPKILAVISFFKADQQFFIFYNLAISISHEIIKTVSKFFLLIFDKM